MNLPIPTVLCALAALGMAGCGAGAAASKGPAPTPVTIATALAPGERALFRGPGSVAAAHTYKVGFEIAGRITSVRHDVGDRVGVGEVLATIDRSDYDAQFRAAAARAASARVAAAKAANGSRPQERTAADDAAAAAQAQLDRARAGARLARSNRARYDELFRDGNISAQQHDSIVAADNDAQAQVAAARAQLAQIRAQGSLVNSGSRREDLAAADADATAAAANADLAAVTLRKTTIVAPADAYVLTRSVEPGSEAQPGGIAFTLTDARDPDVLVAVPESKLGRIAPGTRAALFVEGRRSTGTVARIEPAADPATRTASVRIRVPGLRLRPGSVVDVALGERRVPGTAAVPIAAIVTAPDGSQSVAVFDRARATTVRRGVHVLDSQSDRALVTGIAPGTLVVGAGAQLVAPGTPVRVVSGS
ncbi:MAG: efflux RND transporter periplasmic adaptor subunit [Candidatus Velthaea sp.]